MVQVVMPSTPSVRTDAGGGGGGGGVTAVGVGDVLELSPHPNVTASTATAINAGMLFNRRIHPHVIPDGLYWSSGQSPNKLRAYRNSRLFPMRVLYSAGSPMEG